MKDFRQSLEKYAELAVKVGVNVQPGQTLVVRTTLEGAELVRIITKKAYEAGAHNVIVQWSDDTITRLKYEHAGDDVFKTFPVHQANETNELAEQGASFLSVISSSPDLLKGVALERLANNQKASGQALSKFRQIMQADKVCWSIVAVPSQAWADMVFPDAPEEDRITLLWEAIFKATRIDQDNPVEAWKKHDDTLHTKVDYLNGKHYKKLHYKAPGTDLTVELPEKHIWCGAGSISEAGVEFMANMPTEEVFSMPLKTGVNGTVSSTKPLSYNGNIIDNFSLTFENGRIVNVKAEVGEDVLKDLIETDEGSHYLGEVALVPHHSPISESNILYYNTLFDENASNHLAIGSAYAFNLDGGKTMSREELNENGANESITHVDFMIGSDQMDIDGITEDGKEEPIFRNGNWAF
ncbi:aminopeptidase [Bacillus sp. 1P06AnD]|uniref:aminopeptidase n=1 Tax=Bacillus sp. 1P06AnD TaxID=3132208 RepID=UPI0039A1C5F3